NPLTICDPGHNVAGIKEIIKQLDNIKYKALHFVIGMVNDKSIGEVLNLLPRDAIYYFTKANIPRAMPE
ncbi:MAG: bifunctional folylpolyglutamate synthase/dihydrofolate synthase, partial [Flavobacteriales bacterium]|nr:bifunctional folylpolyglutamate synthase/dihydrofolate synthase [Flavobacteriales bacterium]